MNVAYLSKYAMPSRYWLQLWSCLLKEEEAGIGPFLNPWDLYQLVFIGHLLFV